MPEIQNCAQERGENVVLQIKLGKSLLWKSETLPISASISIFKSLLSLVATMLCSLSAVRMSLRHVAVLEISLKGCLQKRV